MQVKYKIGVFGSAEGDIQKIKPQLHALAKQLADKNVIIITGATSGVPYEVSYTAHTLGVELWGYSQATSFEEQEKQVASCDNSIYTKLFYIPKGYEFASNQDICRKYRNVTSTATCDAGIIVSGRFGTLNEFTNLYDCGKVIGVLTKTGGIADELEGLMKRIHKPTSAKVFFDYSSKELIAKVLAEVHKRSGATHVV